MFGSDVPANFTPLTALPMVVLDLETTGLDVSRDRIVQIGAVCMHGARIEDGPHLDRLVDPGMPIPQASTRIHGLDDASVSGAESFGACIEELQSLIKSRVVIGHHIGFDLAILRHEASRIGANWQEPAYLDLATLSGALEPALPDLGLESLADWLGVEVSERHTAIGDCMTTAHAFAALLVRLREANVRTLGEATALCARRSDLLERQERAGWNAIPGDAPARKPARPFARLDTQVYSKRLDEVMHAPPVAVEPSVSLRDAAALMVERRIGSLLILDSNGVAQGILTERDLLRAAARWADNLTGHHVAEAMTSPVQSMASSEMLYRALGRMTRKSIRHLCVTDDAGRAAGMVSQRDLLEHRAQATSALGDAIEEATDGPAMAAVHGQLPAVAEALCADGLDGLDVARVVSNEVRALTERAAVITETDLTAQGLGPAPGRWCVLVLGSAGRGESLLTADQDNALIHDGKGDDDQWYAAMGAGIAELLDHAGIPLCTGGVMASNSKWRGTTAQWKDRIGGWLTRAQPEDLLNVDIFFDMTPVAGELSLIHELQTAALEAASSNPTFISMLADSVMQLTPSLGLFGRLPTDEGRIDLKRHGLLPLVSLARVLALRIGSSARATPDRIHEAAAAGRVSPGDAKRLVRIHRELMTSILKQQLEDLHEGVKPSSRVDINRLERSERRELGGKLRDLSTILDSLRGAVSR
jgi:signal-transduction protein with cAMP-binding, CBS, and nucleotidyltransferase domain